jgi:hypothetical protein
MFLTARFGIPIWRQDDHFQPFSCRFAVRQRGFFRATQRIDERAAAGSSLGRATKIQRRISQEDRGRRSQAPGDTGVPRRGPAEQIDVTEVIGLDVSEADRGIEEGRRRNQRCSIIEFSTKCPLRQVSASTTT